MRRQRRGGGMVAWLFETLVFMLTLIFFGGMANKWVHLAPPPMLPSGGDATTAEKPIDARMTRILVLGMDSVDGTHRTDTMMLICVDPVKGKVTAMSIPRDTRVVIGGDGHKINEIKASFGIQFLRSWLEELFEVPIDRYAVVDYQAFVRIVDLLGGVDVNVEKTMVYDDNYANLHIRFSPGPQHLTGKKALEYVRFRHDAQADLGRIQRQQAFLGQLMKQAYRPEVVMRLPEILGVVFKHIETDASVVEVLELAMALRGRKVGFHGVSMPGVAEYVFETKYKKKISYYLASKTACITLANEHFVDVAALSLDSRWPHGAGSGTATLSSPLPVAAVGVAGGVASAASLAVIVASEPVPATATVSGLVATGSAVASAAASAVASATASPAASATASATADVDRRLPGAMAVIERPVPVAATEPSPLSGTLASAATGAASVR